MGVMAKDQPLQSCKMITIITTTSKQRLMVSEICECAVHRDEGYLCAFSFVFQKIGKLILQTYLKGLQVFIFFVENFISYIFEISANIYYLWL